MSCDAVDAGHMAEALRLAERGLYTAAPNPRVGALVVDSAGDVAGRGYHVRAGEPHAEIHALTEAGARARGATCYVTLEPCAHRGRTGPCAEALIEAGVSRVVFGHEDPNPKVAGAGIERLRQAGIVVDGPLLESEARALNPGFIRRMATGRPLVRIKMAMSLDGRTAMADGHSFWITGPAARADVQRLRGRSCAIVSSARTVQRDQASLTVRPLEFGLDEPGLGERQPLRVVLDSRGELQPDQPFFRAGLPALVVTTSASGREAEGDVEWVSLPGADGRVDLRALLAELARRECNEVLVEAGSELAAGFLRQGLCDELVLYVAGKLMGSDAMPLFRLPLDRMDEALPTRIAECRVVGRDLRITAIPELD